MAVSFSQSEKGGSVSLSQSKLGDSLTSSQSLGKIAINSCKYQSVSVHTADPHNHRLPLLNHHTSYELSQTKPAKKTFLSTDELEADIQSDMRKYRLKYLFCQSCSTFCISCRRRFPSEKSVYLALLLCFLERVAYYAAVGNILQPFLINANPHFTPFVHTLLFSVYMDMLAQLLFPLFGWIADAWVGRYNMLHFSMWFLWLGYGLLTFLFSLDNHITWNRYLLPVWMIVINIGSAAFQANAVPFGADQIMYGTSEHISSFFYWYYWMRNFGAIFLSLSFTCSNPHAQWHGYITFGLLSTASMSLALVLNGLMKNWFHIDDKRRNPLWTIIKIFLAATVAKRPKIRSAFSYSNLAAPTRIDLTKDIHGGKFDCEEVENAKTVGRIVIVLLSVSGALIVYRGVINIIGIQMQGMRGRPFFVVDAMLLGHCHFDSDFSWILNVAVVLVTILFLNHCVVPFLREYRPNMLKKIGIGYMLVILTSVCILAIIGAGENGLRHDGRHGYRNATQMCIFSDLNERGYVKLPIHYGMIVIPHILISMAEVFINVSCLEFCYAQSPHNMRGLMIGFFFFIWGFSDTVATSLLTLFSLKRIGPPESCNFWYHMILLIVGVITFVTYVLVARRYRNRKRPISNENYVYYNLMKTSNHNI